MRFIGQFLGFAFLTFVAMIVVALGVAIVFGGSAMQEETRELPSPVADPASKWTEKVKIIPFAGGTFLNPHENQDAYPVTLAGQPGFGLRAIFLYAPGTEIVQSDGSRWAVVSSHLGDAETRCIVRKLPSN